MLSKQFRFLVTGLVLVVLALAAAAQESRPKVAIKTFENPANYSRSTIGSGLTDILTTELENTGKFNVLERSSVDELTKEVDFGNSDYAKGSTFAKKGNLLGAQYLLMGKVTNYSYSERGERRNKVNLLGPNTIVTIYQQQAEVRVDFRLIDVASSETILSQAGEAHATNTSEISEMDAWRRIISGSVAAESSSSLIGRATTDAVKDIVRKLNSLSQTVRQPSSEAAMSASIDNLGSAKGEVAAEEGGGLWIVGGIGNANGLRVGGHLRIVHENLVKDKTGKVIYRKPVEIGSMEITDVSQPDHAEARFLPSSGGGASVSPQASDVVTIDIDYARMLRGTASSPAVIASTAGASAPATAVSAPQLEEAIKRGDSYVRDQFWSQALDEYKHAASMNPNELRALQGEALSHYMLGDFIEGDEITDKLLQAGGSFSFPIAHFHSMGTCTGEFKIQRGKLAYSSGKGDGFDIGPQGLVEIEVKKLSKGMMANEKLPDWPMINIRFRDSGGHEKDYQMLPSGYSKEQSLSGKNLASAFPMGDSDVHEMQKFEESMVTLIHKYAK